MNTKNLLIGGLLGGLISTALSNIPVISLVNCLLCVGFWGGAVFAVWYYKRQTGSVTLGQGIAIGAVAGLFAGVFGFILSLIGAAGIGPMMENMKSVLPQDAQIELPQPGVATVIFNILGAGVNIVFGAIGGLVGGLIFKPKAVPPAAM